MAGAYQVRIELAFAAGHRLLGHRGKCVYPHGHSYLAEVWVRGDALDGLGFVVDFAELKGKLGRWVEEHWDHAFLLNSEDEELLSALKCVKGSRIVLFSGENPSAEVLARELFVKARELSGLCPDKVRVWESPTQYAQYSLSRAQLD